MDEREHELILPPISDQDNICLPLSVNAVSKYWNIELPLSEAIEKAKKYSNTSGGILIEGIELAERHGLSCLILNSDIDKLKRIIQIGIPPIVILPGLHEMVQHASIISGYDDNEKTIFHYVPNQTATEDGIQVGVIPEDRFDKLWSEDDRLMILLAPSEIISKLMDEDENIAKSNRLCFQSERSSLQQNKIDANKLLDEAIELNPKNSTAFLLLAGIQNEQNDHECINNYQKSLEINNRCYLAYRGLGNFYLKINKYEESENFYNKAIEINNNRFGPIYKNRAIVRQQQNKMSKAKEDFERYLKFTPNAKDRGLIEQALKEF